MSTRVQFPLTLLLPIKKEFADPLRKRLENAGPGGPLSTTGLVHFARLFVFPENNPAGIPSNIAAVITSYDGDFQAYVQAFVDNEEAGKFFNEVLTIVDIDGAKDLIPVQQNAKAFAALVAKYDVTNVAAEPWGEWFSAYPGATVQNIKDCLDEES